YTEFQIGKCSLIDDEALVSRDPLSHYVSLDSRAENEGQVILSRHFDEEELFERDFDYNDLVEQDSEDNLATLSFDEGNLDTQDADTMSEVEARNIFSDIGNAFKKVVEKVVPVAKTVAPIATEALKVASILLIRRGTE